MEADRIKQAWEVYSDLSLRVSGVAQKRMKTAIGLTQVDYTVLAALCRAETGQVRMGKLARLLSYSPSRLSYLVTSLADRGFIERISTDEDGRGLSASITKAGRAAWERANQIQHSVFTTYLLDKATAEEKRLLQEIFFQIAQRVEDSLADVDASLGEVESY